MQCNQASIRYAGVQVRQAASRTNHCAVMYAEYWHSAVVFPTMIPTFYAHTKAVYLLPNLVDSRVMVSLYAFFRRSSFWLDKIHPGYTILLALQYLQSTLCKRRQDVYFLRLSVGFTSLVSVK